jgi:hypothetical protein
MKKGLRNTVVLRVVMKKDGLDFFCRFLYFLQFWQAKNGMLWVNFFQPFHEKAEIFSHFMKSLSELVIL